MVMSGDWFNFVPLKHYLFTVPSPPAASAAAMFVFETNKTPMEPINSTRHTEKLRIEQGVNVLAARGVHSALRHAAACRR
jgi:hypothetical protein